MLGQKGTYSVGRFCLAIVELIALIAIGLGLVDAVMGLTTNEGLGILGEFGDGAMIAVPGACLAIVGFALMAWTQVSRARFDTAEMTKELLTKLGGA